MGAAIGGVRDSIGFWFELKPTVTGPTINLPAYARINPQRVQLGVFDNNVAHSNYQGIMTYTRGMLANVPAFFR